MQNDKKGNKPGMKTGAGSSDTATHETETSGESGTTRRRLLTTLGLGGSAIFLPAIWHKPIVRSLLLPAHAQTSPPEPPTGEPPMFANCLLTLSFQASPFGLPFACTDGANTYVIPTVSGDITGSGDLSGIEIDIESTLIGASTPTSISGTATTDSNGHYELELNGYNGDTGPHIVCTEDCGGDTYFPSGGTVNAVVTSTDSRLTGQESMCMDTFTCNDLTAT
ncbi:MAG: hypothetical protein WB783_13140 [Arenicellales bacterium]